MLDIEIHPEAQTDLSGIWLYSFENWGEKQADRYYDALINGMDLIASNPEIGIACDDIREGYRCFRIKEHDAYYKITKARIVIVRVLHESMKPSLHF